MNKYLVIFSALLFSFNTNSEVIHSERSLYSNVIVEDTANIRCLKFSLKRKTSNQSCINKNDPNALVFNYTKLLFASFLVMDEPKNVLIIGLGGGTMSNSIHQIFPQAKITNVEIDPAVVKVARDYFSFIENGQVTTETKDGRIFVKRAMLKKQQYDWIILDAFNGDYIPEHLMTQEFLAEVNSILSSNGVLSANTFSSSKLYDYESATYQSVFGKFYNIRFDGEGNRVILSKKSGLLNAEEIAKKAAALQQTLLPFAVNAQELANLMTTEIDWPAQTLLLTDQFSPANLLKN